MERCCRPIGVAPRLFIRFLATAQPMLPATSQGRERIGGSLSESRSVELTGYQQRTRAILETPQTRSRSEVKIMAARHMSKVPIVAAPDQAESELS